METQSDVGSTLRLFLRRASAAAVHETSGTGVILSARDGMTVLVVDDEPPVGELVAKILSAGGYTVLEAHSGSDALAVARNWQGPIHLLLTDVVMAEMGGPALADHLAVERPDVQIIFMSGYSHDSVVTQLQTAGRHFIPKPFVAKELVTLVRNVLRVHPNP